MEPRGEIVKAGAIATLALIAFAIVTLLAAPEASAGCTGLSGNYAILLQGFAALGLPIQPAAGVGAIQLNPETCTVTGELIYNANGTVVVYPTLIYEANPGFSGTSAQLTGTYSLQNPYSGTLSFTDNGTCAGCSNSGTSFNFTITASRGTEIFGTSTGGGPILTLTAEKQAAFSPTQVAGAYPFDCVAIGLGAGVGTSLRGPLSLSGTIVYPLTTCLLPAPSSDNCVGGSIVFNYNGTIITDGLTEIGGEFLNTTDATISNEDLVTISSGVMPVTEMNRVLWGSTNQYHWIIGTNGPGAGVGGPGVPAYGPDTANVVTCTGGADPAGTVTIAPTSMSLVTSPKTPSRHTATRNVTITNNTARYLAYAGSNPNSGPPPVSVTSDNCSGYNGFIAAFSSCSFTVVCTNSGGTSVTSVPIAVGVDQAATNDPTNVVNVSCTN
jgi:hypothetical protein